MRDKSKINAARRTKRATPEEKAKIKKRNRSYYLRNKKKIAKQVRDYRDRDRERYRDRQLRYKFGITLEQYRLLLERQGGGCAICGAKISAGKGTVMRVDHEHSTGKIRGLLCQHCNCGLGHFKDSTALLSNAIRYLQS